MPGGHGENRAGSSKGGRSSTWPERLERADALIWLDVPLSTRYRRVFWRTLRHYGRNRPDLPAGCPERFSSEFLAYMWQTRHSSRQAMQALHDRARRDYPDRVQHHLCTLRQTRRFVENLRYAACARQPSASRTAEGCRHESPVLHRRRRHGSDAERHGRGSTHLMFETRTTDRYPAAPSASADPRLNRRR